MSLVVFLSNQHEIETGDSTREYSGNVFPYVSNQGDLTVIKETNQRNKTIACFAAGTWKEVKVL